jgi:signal transduction histidine kinase
MRLSIQAKQIAGVTAIVTLAVAVVSSWYVASLARVRLEETRARAELVANAVYQRAYHVVAAGGDPYKALQTDDGLQSILQAGLYSNNVTYAAIVDTSGHVIAHSDITAIGTLLPDVPELGALLERGPVEQLQAIYEGAGRNLEFRKPLLLGETEFGSIRVGISTLLIRAEFLDELQTPLLTLAIAIAGAIVVSMLLARLVVRPIHVIRSGLARLGRGELDVSVDLPKDAELADLGESFRAISARLAADRTELAGQRATLGSVVDRLEDAVALFGPDGSLLFANPAMRPALGGDAGSVATLLPDGHPYRAAVESSLASRQSRAPVTIEVPGLGNRLVLTNVVESADHAPLGVMLVSRNLAYLSRVQSTLSYSRKLAALGRLSAGLAHEVKNPLNATMIHLELLKMHLADTPEAAEHLAVIAAQVRRLDEVMQGFLKFTRPEELQLQPVALLPLIDEVRPIIDAEAGKHHVEVDVAVPADLPPANADPGLLQQAFLNLAINACQAMPDGGRLRISGATRGSDLIEVVFEDTGVGIDPQHLARIFDLYYTTKAHGSGIGLSLAYRTIQMHDGEIEVESTPGRGTTFRVTLRRAQGTGD